MKTNKKSPAAEQSKQGSTNQEYFSINPLKKQGLIDRMIVDYANEVGTQQDCPFVFYGIDEVDKAIEEYANGITETLMEENESLKNELEELRVYIHEHSAYDDTGYQVVR